jgi:hypothetical protein
MGAWFAASDGISFVSNRMSRDGVARFYGMTVAIDPNTGRTVGSPRQITTEEAAFLSRPSPDGKWMAYVPPRYNAIKLIPATGGTPRTLATIEGAHGPIEWSSDGKTLLVAVGGPAWMPPYGTWYRVSIADGTVMRAYRASLAMPFPANNALHLVFTPSTTENHRIARVELFDAKDQSLGAADVPQGMMPSVPIGAKNGFYGLVTNHRNLFHIIPTGGGTSHVADMPTGAWFYAWTADGLIVGGGERSNAFVALMDTEGKLRARAPLPAGARGVGWEGAIGSVATFYVGAQSWNGDDGKPLYIADVRTGSIRKLTDRGFEGGDNLQGRGGVPGVDDGRFLHVIGNGSTLELRSFATDGQSKLLRRFARGDRVAAFGVHGDRVAWAIRSRDSLIVFSARGVMGGARRVLALRRVPPGQIQVAWSNEGSVLAWAGSSEPAIGFVRMDDDGAPTGKPTPLNPRASGPWGMWWSKDDRALLVIAKPTGEREEQMVRVPVNPAEAPTVLSEVGDEIGTDFVTLSPDGKYIASPDSKATGTSIWRVDFLPPTKKP